MATEQKRYGATPTGTDVKPPNKEEVKDLMEGDTKVTDLGAIDDAKCEPDTGDSSVPYNYNMAVCEINYVIKKLTQVTGDNAIQAIGKLRGAIIKLQG